MTFGDRLRILRAALAISQAELATRSGYAPATLSHIETGKHRPRPATTVDLSGALGVPAIALSDDVACLQELARIMGVSLAAAAGEIAQDDPLMGAARELTARLGRERSTFLADTLRGLANLVLVGPPARTSPVLPASSSSSEPDGEPSGPE